MDQKLSVLLIVTEVMGGDGLTQRKDVEYEKFP